MSYVVNKFVSGIKKNDTYKAIQFVFLFCCYSYCVHTHTHTYTWLFDIIREMHSNKKSLISHDSQWVLIKYVIKKRGETYMSEQRVIKSCMCTWVWEIFDDFLLFDLPAHTGLRSTISRFYLFHSSLTYFLCHLKQKCVTQ